MPAGHLLKLAFDGLLLVLIIGFIGWFFIRTIAKSENPKLLTFKWVLTVAIAAAVTVIVRPLVKAGGSAVAFAIPVATVAGIILAVVWRRNIAELIAAPFGNLYTGGATAPEPKPVYSPALALRNRGNYQEAFNSVRKELEKFPGDFEGQMLLGHPGGKSQRPPRRGPHHRTHLQSAGTSAAQYRRRPEHTHGLVFEV